MKKLLCWFLVLTLVMSMVPFVVAAKDDERRGGPSKTIPDALGQLKKVNAQQIKNLIQKKEVLQLGANLKKCKDSEEENCKDLVKEARIRVRNSLRMVTERTSNVLNKLKERIEGADFDGKDEALEEINAGIAGVEEAKEKVLALTGDSTKEEIKTAITELKSALKEAKELVKKYYSKSKVNTQKLQNAINKFTKLVDNIESRLNRFEERGYDFSDLKNILENVRSEVESAQSSLGDGDNSAVMEHLRNAHKYTLQILKQFRAGLGEKPEEEPEAECETNDDCGEGETCQEGECEEEEEEVECETNEDCGEGMLCDEEGECEERCTSDEDCDDDEVCIENECEDEEGDDNE